MEKTPAKKEDKFSKEVYRKKMEKIEFMEQFLEDPDIFNPESEKFRNFLVQSYSYLHPGFNHLVYSPLLSNEDIDHELVKASKILQILPGNTLKKGEKLFGSMTKTDIHKFWIRFFTLFQLKKDDKHTTINSTPSCILNDKFKIFKNIDETLNYVNFDFPIFKEEKLKGINVNDEIEKWKSEPILYDVVENEPTACSFQTSVSHDVNIEKLIIDLKQIVVMYNGISVDNEKFKTEYDEFFNNFVSLSKNILKYKNDLSIIDSSIIEDLCAQALQENFANLTNNVYFLKKLNNLIETLRTKIKLLK